MKIGSLVMRPSTSELVQYAAINGVNTAPLMKGFEGVVRAIDPGSKVGLLFVGITNPIGEGGLEIAYDERFFREIEFPPALTESIQECLTRELEVVK